MTGMRRSFAFFWICIGFLVLVSAPAFAALFGTVDGIVRDPQGSLIPGAQVTLNAKP
jgi:hypothetical protein